MSFLRQPVGSSDFTAAASHYTYDDVSAGATDFPLARFSVAHDQAQILPLLRRARQLNPRLSVMATPWSPPAWMKTTNSLVGGRLKDDPAVYDAYARYLVKFVQAYGSVTTNAEYYTIGHLSKFVQPGAVRIGSTSFGTTGWNGQIMDVAFRNPDGSTALVVHNENDDPRSFAVAVGDQLLEYTLPGGALATFTWPQDRSLRSRLEAVSLRGATATAVPTGEGAAAAVDEDGSTRWSSGPCPAAGQYLQVDLGSRTTFRRVAIDSGGNLGDYARGWQLSTSDNGTDWRVLASGTGTGQLTNVDVQRTRARYLRVSATADAGNWWSISDIRLYE